MHYYVVLLVTALLAFCGNEHTCNVRGHASVVAVRSAVLFGLSPPSEAIQGGGPKPPRIAPVEGLSPFSHDRGTLVLCFSEAARAVRQSSHSFDTSNIESLLIYYDVWLSPWLLFPHVTSISKPN